MKLIEGGNLLQRLHFFQTEPRNAARAVADVALAVHHAHQRGILHRDLKPSNVLLDNDGRPHVTDFGLAKWMNTDSELTQSGFLVGTPSYMAPEQAAAGPAVERNVTTATDIYGLGAVLYGVLAGRPPFEGGTVLHTLEQVRTQEPVPLRRLQPRVPGDLETICLKCLEKEPHRRYPSAQALADDLERFLAGKPIAARRVRTWEKTWKWARRKPAVASLLAISMLTALALALCVLIYNGQLRQAVAIARANEKQALEQHELADERYRLARDSMRRMLARLDAGRVADVPRLMELRLTLLEDAQGFFQKVLDQANNPDPSIRIDVALIVAGTGSSQYLLGRPAAARPNLERAVALLENLHKELPNDHAQYGDCLDHLAGCHAFLAALDNTAGYWDDALRHLHASLGLYERMAGDRPNDPKWLDAQARTEHFIGAHHQTRGQRDEAVTHYEKSIALRNRMISAYPNVEAYQIQLAETDQNLGLLYAHAGRTADARTVYEKTIKLFQPLTVRHPENDTYPLTLAAAYVNFGGLLMQVGAPDQAVQMLDLGIKSVEALLEREPRHTFARARGVEAHGTRAQLHEKLGQWAEAVKDWDRVVELNDAPGPWRYRLCRAVALTRAGEHARAAAEAHALETDPQVPADGQGDIGQVYAWSVELARKDLKLPPAKREALAEEYAVRAVAIYSKLLAAGHFKNPVTAKEFVNDQDLRVLHDRPEFQKVLMQVKSGMRP
jgi:tetratricopeptide (TPR) repeat protein